MWFNSSIFSLLFKPRTGKDQPVTFFESKQHHQAVCGHSHDYNSFFESAECVNSFASLDDNKIVLISSFHNERALLPYWIRHHADMVDAAILIDYNSTDGSREIALRESPPSWVVLSSKHAAYNAGLATKEYLDYERIITNAWKIDLETSEFLVYRPDWLKLQLAEMNSINVTIARFPSLLMVGDSATMLRSLDARLPLVLQRPQYVIPEGARTEWQPAFGVTTQYSRYIHRHASVQYFGANRHIVVNNRTDFPDEVRFLPNGFIGKYEVRLQLFSLPVVVFRAREE